MSCETWNMGWILMVPGSFKRTAEGLMMRSVGNGGDNFLDSVFNGIFLVESQTF